MENFIKKSRVEESPSGKRWWVMHPHNSAILASCDTQEEAQRFAERADLLADENFWHRVATKGAI